MSRWMVGRAAFTDRGVGASLDDIARRAGVEPDPLPAAPDPPPYAATAALKAEIRAGIPHPLNLPRYASGPLPAESFG